MPKLLWLLLWMTMSALLMLGGRSMAGEAEELVGRGEFRKAADVYLEMAGRAAGKDDRKAAAALMNAAGCMKMSGDVSAAALYVEQVRPLLGDRPERRELLEWLALKGSVLALGKRPSKAVAPLVQAMDLVRDDTDAALVIDIRNDLGIALSSAGVHGEAVRQFAQAAEVARSQGGGTGLLRSLQNHLVASFQQWQEAGEKYRQKEELNVWREDERARMVAARGELDASLAAAVAALGGAGELSLVGLHLRITAAMAAHRSGDVGMANGLFARGLELARESGNVRFEAAALLGLAEQYVDDRRFADGLALLDGVRGLPGELDEPEVARLEVLTAVCRHALEPRTKRTGDAIRRAVAAVETIRNDLARSQLVSDLGRGFRELSGRPYLLLADHLLGPGADEKALREARDSVEAFKTWELNDFYRDDCVNLALAKAGNLDRLGDAAVAVIYVIPLEDRVELLVGHDSGLRRFTSRVPGEAVYAAARRLRHRLEKDKANYRFYGDADWLYEQLIAPAAGVLQQLGVRHLVFVADGALANVPLGALRDGGRKRYLLEDYSVSVAPNLSMLAPDRSEGESPPLLAGGLSESVQGYPAIPAVAGELQGVAGFYAANHVLVNGAFTTEAIGRSLAEDPADIIHFASHGEFLGRAEGCFLLTHDGRLTLDELEAMIRPRKFIQKPVNLLCLSACRTAAGDDRAALGLAGASVKSGARSVLATLWYVEDESSAQIMTRFHRYLSESPGRRDTAGALRKAQLEALGQEETRHPAKWGPFVLVGAWR